MSMQKIRYITFEGGGGKGAAYLGAIEVLKEQKIIRYFREDLTNEAMTTHLDPESIKGLAGSSAGAITATLLAAGLMPCDIRSMLLQTEQFSAVYKDHDCYGQIPTIVARKQGAGALTAKPLVMKTHNSDQVDLGKGMKVELVRILAKLANTVPAALVLGLGLESVLVPSVLGDVKEEMLKAAKELHFYFDLGLLDGGVLHKIVADKLKQQLGDSNITFSQMFEKTHIHLKLTGTCMQTHETVWFDHLGPWKNMCVADAVRISASFPLVFKPVAIIDRDTFNDGTRTGFLMIDGGVLNNNPIHAFDDPKSSEPICLCEAMLLGGKRERRAPRRLNPEVLSLRLDCDSAVSGYIGFWSYFGGLADTVASQSERSVMVDPGAFEQTIVLDTAGLSTLDFAISKGTPDDPDKSPEDKLNEVVERSRRATLAWLNSGR
jgi:predicted acylesterase/phospholipase RssA